MSYLLAVGACGIIGPAERRVLGTIFYESSATIDDVFAVPESAQAGVAFSVTVTTDVGNCIRGGRAEVVVRGRDAVVTPYDVHSGNDDCTVQGLTPFVHQVSVAFGSPGPAQIILRAREFRTREVVEFTKTVQIN